MGEECPGGSGERRTRAEESEKSAGGAAPATAPAPFAPRKRVQSSAERRVAAISAIVNTSVRMANTIDDANRLQTLDGRFPSGKGFSGRRPWPRSSRSGGSPPDPPPPGKPKA